MTHLLEQLIAAAAKLSPDQQDALAQRWLADLADDQAWDDSLAASPDVLAKLAAEALAEHSAGLTRELDPDQL